MSESMRRTAMGELVGIAIRERRQYLELSQGALALALGVTRTSVTNYESGTQLAPLTVLYEIAGVLTCDYRSLLPSPQEIEKWSPADNGKQRARELFRQRAELIEQVRALDAEIEAIAGGGA